MSISRIGASTGALLLTLATAQAQDRLFDASKPLEIADQGAFSVPGRYVEVGKDTIMVGQMFVQYQVPKNKTRPYPVVMIHGGGQTGINFLGTPDGRRGWADDFVAHGYAVYVVDQSGRGRSGFFTDVYGKTRKSTVGNATPRFTVAGNQPSSGRRPRSTPNGPARARRAIRLRRVLCHAGRDHRRRGDDRGAEPRRRGEAARPHRPRRAAGSFAGRRDRLERRRRAAAARQRHPRHRAERPADPGERRQGRAGLLRRRRR